VHLETIRYYERTGLIRKPKRTSSGHRVFDETDIERLRLIRCARQLGFPTEVIKRLVELADEKPNACNEVQAFASAQIHHIDERLGEWSRMRETLLGLIQTCPDAAARDAPCPMLVTMKQERCCGAVAGPRARFSVPD
jgi:DNA-binding transcriptional MerR regulator